MSGEWGFKRDCNQLHLQLHLFVASKSGLFPMCLVVEKMWLLSCFIYHDLLPFLQAAYSEFHSISLFLDIKFSLFLTLLQCLLKSLISDDALLSNEVLKFRCSSLPQGMMVVGLQSGKQFCCPKWSLGNH